MNQNEDKKILPIVKEHWKNKFEKSVIILKKSGYQIDELIIKKKEIISEDEKKNQDNGTAI